MYVWEPLWKQCVFGNPWGNNVCLEIPWKQCRFGDPWGNIYACEALENNVCLGMFEGEHGAFENSFGNSACLGILIETVYV